MQKKQITILTKRLPYLDYARLSVAYLVILGHLIPADDRVLRPYIYAFHMPLFFIISGMLHKNKESIPWRKYLVSIVWPFIIWNVLFFIIQPFFILWGIWNIEVVKGSNIIEMYLNQSLYLMGSFLHSGHYINGPTWFLPVLLFCKILTDIMKLSKWYYAGYIILMCVCLYHPFNYLGFGSTLMAFPFYIVGVYGKSKIDILIRSDIKIGLAVLLFIISIPMTYLNKTISVYNVCFGFYSFLPIRLLFCYCAAFACSLSIILFSASFKQRVLVAEWANALITILCAQSLFNYIYRSHFNMDNYFMGIVTSAFIFILCIYIHKLFGKWIYMKI